MKRILGLIVGVFFCGIVMTYGVTQETPVGKVSGILTMKENGKPLDGAAVSLVPIHEDDEEVFSRIKAVETDETGRFTFDRVPTGPYFIEISAKQHSKKKQGLVVEEAKTTEVDLAAAPNAPFLQLYASQKVFTAEEIPQIELHGFMPSQNAVQIDLYRLELNEIAKNGSLSQTLSPLSSPRKGDVEKLEHASVKVQDLSHPISKVDAEGAFIEPIKLAKQNEGIYFIICRAGGVKAVTAINISDLALVTKSYEGQVLCYATHLKNGTPVPDVEILTTKDGLLQPSGKTDKDGIAEINLPKVVGLNSLVLGRKGASVAIVGFREGSADDEKVRITGYCERPAYRPGDEIHFKGIARRRVSYGYELPGAGTASIKITDPDGNVLSTSTLPVSPHGTFNGSFTTSKEGKPGGYTVKCSAFGSGTNIDANVVAYRKPEYSIEVKSDKPHFTMGDEASATVECQYYYGGPVVGAKVKARIYRSPAWQYENENGERQTSSDGAGEYSNEVEAVTDASGRAKIKFPTRTENDPQYFTNNYKYTVSASVSEDKGKYFDGQGDVEVVRGDHNMTIEAENPIVGPGESVDLLIKTTDPVNWDKPSPNHTVTVEVGRDTWTNNESVFILRYKKEVTTGADGTAHLLVPVSKAESLAFRATSKDARGNLVVASTGAYVEGSPAERDRESGTFGITLDKRTYKAGDTARVLLETDMIGGTALLCVELDGIRSKQLVPITSASTLIKLPVTKEYAPSASISVVYIKNKKFIESQRQLKVERQDRDLKILIKSDHEVYKPGDTAKVTIVTVDSKGKPCPAEVSLGVVDEGIYDIAEDTTDLKTDFYPSRSSRVQTSYSFPEIYLDGGDKGSSKVPLRKTFRDTAQWNPSVWTGKDGRVTVPVVLPDNLTEWRITAVGISDKTEVGMETESFTARKDLMVRLQLPQFLVDGDRQRMTVVVANDTGKDQDVNLEMSAQGVTMTDGAKRVVHVQNGKPLTVECEITAAGPGDAAITAKAWIDGGPNDGVKQSFPVSPHGRPVLEAKSGLGPVTMELPIRPTADPKVGTLKISLSPSLAGDLVGSLDGPIGFPYGCVEQTMSRFMPSVLVDKTVRDLGLPRPKKLNDLPKIVRDSLTRLQSMRHSDGGFGWWEYDESDMFMTGLVLDGLARARDAGQNISQLDLKDTFEWGLKRLKAHKASDRDRDRDRFYLAFGLLQFGQKDAAASLEKIDFAKLSPVTLATAALALHAAGHDDQANAALDLLRQSALGGDVAFWASEEWAWGEEPSALALTAFMAIRPDDPMNRRIALHLRQVKRGEMWTSTRDTAYSLVGLTAYLAHTKELVGETVATVLVNGKAVRTTTLNPKIMSDPDWTIEIPRRDLGTGNVKIEIQKQGEGACYYSAELHTLDTAPTLMAESTDPDLKLNRRYYRLEARALENGTMKLLPSRTPVDSFKSGDLVRVELTVTTKTPRRFLMIEEPTPSSCRVQEREQLGEYEEWNFWWSRTVIKDDRLAYFVTDLPPGVHKVSYTMRAEQAGKIHCLPTSVANMYDPTKYSSTAENILEVVK